jgi:hypothetical protein
MTVCVVSRPIRLDILFPVYEHSGACPGIRARRPVRSTRVAGQRRRRAQRSKGGQTSRFAVRSIMRRGARGLMSDVR